MALFSKDIIEIGATAPAVEVTTHTGATIDMGKLYEAGPVLVYFYPRSDTPGCTKQACNIRDNFEALTDAGVEVIGVSNDDVEAQQAFREKYNLPFTLVADTDKKLGDGFGVGSIIGVAYKRQSFLVVDGKVVWRDLKATPTTQAEDALTALKEARSSE